MNVAHAVARRSPCHRRQVGAVIVSASNRILATGYNGFAATHATASCSTCPRANGGLLERGYDDCFTIHAEANALMFGDRDDRVGGTLYVTSATCRSCTKLITNSGLTRVVMLVWLNDQHRDPQSSVQLLRACGIQVTALQQTGEQR